MTEYGKGRADEKAAIIAYLNETRRLLSLVGGNPNKNGARWNTIAHMTAIGEILKAIGNNSYLEDSAPPVQGNSEPET